MEPIVVSGVRIEPKDSAGHAASKGAHVFYGTVIAGGCCTGDGATGPVHVPVVVKVLRPGWHAAGEVAAVRAICPSYPDLRPDEAHSHVMGFYDARQWIADKDVSTAGAQCPIALLCEPCPSSSLADVAATWGPLPSSRDILAVFKRLVQALAFVHARGYLHLDVHSGNVMLDKTDTIGDSLRLADFGSAQPMQESDTRDSRDEAFKARPQQFYRGPTRGGRWVLMAPEQFAPEQLPEWFGRHPHGDNTVEVYPSSDLYAAAATCVQLVLRRPPFLPVTMLTERDRKFRAIESAAHPLRYPAAMHAALCAASLAEPLSPQAVNVLCKALHPDPRQRYQTAADLLADLETESGGSL